jgi:hypothetical protein
MSKSLTESVPEAIKSVRTRPLFAIREQVPPLYVPGATPDVHFRRVGIVTGGVFEGERLSGEVIGGTDWQNVREDGCTKLDVRFVLKTTDGALILMTYTALRAGPPEVIAKIEKGEPVDPSSYYFRMNPVFETGSAKYGWLNRVLGIGIGHRLADGPIYNIFEIL